LALADLVAAPATRPRARSGSTRRGRGWRRYPTQGGTTSAISFRYPI